MNEEVKAITIHMADDDEDDRLMAEEAMQEARLLNDVHFVKDGVELMEYLCYQGEYNTENAPRPDLILLDLNMPRKDGREALKEIKADPELRRIPIVVLTTSKADEDIYKTYDLGVNSYITKPVTFEGLVEVMKSLTSYWFNIVRLPSQSVSV